MSGYQNFQISVQDLYEGSQYAKARFGRGKRSETRPNTTTVYSKWLGNLTWSVQFWNTSIESLPKMMSQNQKEIGDEEPYY